MGSLGGVGGGEVGLVVGTCSVGGVGVILGMLGSGGLMVRRLVGIVGLLGIVAGLGRLLVVMELCGIES